MNIELRPIPSTHETDKPRAELLIDGQAIHTGRVDDGFGGGLKPLYDELAADPAKAARYVAALIDFKDRHRSTRGMYLAHEIDEVKYEHELPRKLAGQLVLNFIREVNEPEPHDEQGRLELGGG